MITKISTQSYDFKWDEFYVFEFHDNLAIELNIASEFRRQFRINKVNYHERFHHSHEQCSFRQDSQLSLIIVMNDAHFVKIHNWTWRQMRHSLVSSLFLNLTSDETFSCLEFAFELDVRWNILLSRTCFWTWRQMKHFLVSNLLVSLFILVSF